MSLEQDIHQKEFRNEYHKVVLNILYTNNYLVGKLNDVCKSFDITRQQYNVLRILRGQYPNSATINLIKERMLDHMSDASRIVERLRIKALIHRGENENDKRTVAITNTQKGLQLLEKMQPLVDSTDQVVSHLTEGDVIQLNQLLDKVRKRHTRAQSSAVELNEVARQD